MTGRIIVRCKKYRYNDGFQTKYFGKIKDAERHIKYKGQTFPKFKGDGKRYVATIKTDIETYNVYLTKLKKCKEKK